MNTAGRLATAVLALAALAGCADPASPPDPGTAAEATPLNEGYRPGPIDNPVRAADLPADACELLEPGQAEKLGLATARRSESGERACDWPIPDSGGGGKLRLKVLADYGVDEIAARCGSSRCETWSTTTVAGYPAILANGSLETERGLCKMFVGMAEDFSLLVADTPFAGSDGSDCARARQAAGMVVRRLAGDG